MLDFPRSNYIIILTCAGLASEDKASCQKELLFRGREVDASNTDAGGRREGRGGRERKKDERTREKQEGERKNMREK